MNEDVIGELKRIQDELEQNVNNISSLDLDLDAGDQAMFDDSIDEIEQVTRDIDRLIVHFLKGDNVDR